MSAGWATLARPADDARGEAHARRARGLALFEQADYAAAARELEAASAALGDAGESEAAVSSLTLAVEAALRAHDLASASRGLAALEGRPCADDPCRADRLELRALAAREEGRYEPAFALGQEALHIRRAQGDDARTAGTLDLLGELAWFRGELEASRDLGRQATELARRSLGPRHPATARYQASLAVAEYDLGHPAEAIRLEEEALDVTRSARGNDHPETGDRLLDLANFLLGNAEYARALDLYDEVRELHVRRFGRDSDEVAHLLYNTAVLQSRMGRPRQARQAAEEALRLWTKARGPDHPYLTRPLAVIATTALAAGDLATAAASMERAVRLEEASATANPNFVAFRLAELAEVQERQGDLQRARTTLARGMSAVERGHDPRGRPRALLALADAEAALDGPDRALARYRAAAQAHETAFGHWHPATARANARLAGALVRAGHADEALPVARDAEAVHAEHLRHSLRYLSQGQALSMARRPPEGRDVLLTLAASPAAAPAAVGAAWDAVLRSRALVFDEMASRRSVASEPAELREARGRLATYLHRQTIEPRETRATSLEAAHAEVEKLERASAARTASGRGTAREIDTPALSAALGTQAVLVSFVRYADRRLGANAYLAFVLRGGVPHVVPLGPASAIDAAVDGWRAHLRDLHAAFEAPAAAEVATRTAGRRLAELAWDPVAPYVREAPAVFVVPDGSLLLVPWAALPDRAGRYLVESDVHVHVLSAEKDLLRERQAPDPRPTLLAAGGPAYDAEAAPGAAQVVTRGAPNDCPDAPFTFLPGAAEEAREVARTWARYAGDGSAHVLTGAAATETALQRSTSGATVLHLATHGFFDRARCASEEERLAWADHPLLSSGLALAGANVPGQDGLLTAAEVATLDLGRTALVVLSACGTGLGEVQDGEGVLGLYRAFMLAGAGTVVVSLWEVEDTLAAGFSRSFYAAHLGKRLAVPRAVRDAQRGVITDLRRTRGGAPPALWAAFLSVGEWR
jgi:CHAT domain-containing protein/tetratricopeptide (TPR) repeat protein